MLSAGNAATVEFRQTVYIIIVLGRQTEILRQVYNAHIGGNIVVGQKLRALAMPEAEEYDVYLFKRQFVGKTEIGFTMKAGVYFGEQVAGITLTVDENYFGFRMIEQKTAKLAGRISCTANYTYFYHKAAALKLLVIMIGVEHAQRS